MSILMHLHSSLGVYNVSVLCIRHGHRLTETGQTDITLMRNTAIFQSHQILQHIQILEPEQLWLKIVPFHNIYCKNIRQQILHCIGFSQVSHWFFCCVSFLGGGSNR